jgi:glyoxylate reductase
MTKLPRVVADLPVSQATEDLLRGKVELLPWSCLDQLNDVDGIYVFGHPILDGGMMDKACGLRVISNYGVGVDHIDLDAARQRGIPVGNTPNVLDGATADMGFALLLAVARRLAEGDRLARGRQLGTPSNRLAPDGLMLGREVHGAKLGIVGMGRIGLQVAKRAKGFDMQVAYYNRNRREETEAEYGLSYLSLDELLTRSDYVMLCVPLTLETRGLIGERELRMMRPSAALINIARGAVVDTAALTQALQENWIYGAGLDVTEPEPLTTGHPLFEMDNVVITPHWGSATIQTRQWMSELSVRNLLAGLSGEALPNRIV